MAAPSTPANTQLTTPGGVGDLSEYPQQNPAELNRSVLVGYTDVRGYPWWNDPTMQDRTMLYPGAIPTADVEEFFSWDPEVVPVWTGPNKRTADQYMDRRGNAMKALRHPKTKLVFGTFTDGYTIHSRQKWFVDQAAILLDTHKSDLGFGSVGELDGGAKMFTQIELPGNLQVAGLEYRPSFLTVGSFDGSMKTRRKMVHTVAICGNSLGRALGEGGAVWEKKHTRWSDVELTPELAREMRSQLGMFFEESSESFAAEIARMVEQEVTNKQWAAIVDELVPVPEEVGIGRTKAEKKRDQLTNLYTYDLRAAQWNGTALGVFQAFNTWRHTYQTVKGAPRYERNMLAAITNTGAEADDRVREVMAMVLAK